MICLRFVYVLNITIITNSCNVVFRIIDEYKLLVFCLFPFFMLNYSGFFPSNILFLPEMVTGFDKLLIVLVTQTVLEVLVFLLTVLVNLFCYVQVRNPVIVLDEIDKIGCCNQ